MHRRVSSRSLLSSDRLLLLLVSLLIFAYLVIQAALFLTVDDPSELELMLTLNRKAGFLALKHHRPVKVIEEEKETWKRDLRVSLEQWPPSTCRPSVFIIGARKGGTTSLFHYLSSHPRFRGSKEKEPHFFSREFSKKPLQWYWRQFPASEDCLQGHVVAGEASVSYLSSCEAPARIREYASALEVQPKIIVLLRNPVERMVSNHLMRVRFNTHQASSFEPLIRDELRELQPCLGNSTEVKGKACLCQPETQAIPGYIRDSAYDSHIARWLAVFSREDILFLSSVELRDNTLEVMRRVESFVGLSHHDYGEVLSEQLNTKQSEQEASFVTPALQAELAGMFSTSVDQVQRTTGIDLRRTL